MDPSDLQKLLSASKDLSQKSSGLIHALIGNLSELKAHLDTIMPHLGGLHKKMTEGEPSLLVPVEPDVVSESVEVEEESVKPEESETVSLDDKSKE